MLDVTSDAAVEFAKLEYTRLCTEVLESEKDLRIVERIGLAAYFCIDLLVLFDESKLKLFADAAPLADLKIYIWFSPCAVAGVVLFKIAASGIRIKGIGEYLGVLERNSIGHPN